MARKKADFTPPHSIDCEKNVIASMIRENTLIPEISATLKDEDFFRASNGRIFKAIKKAYNTHGHVDTPVLLAIIKGSDPDLDLQLDKEEILDILQDTLNSVPSLAYCEIVKEKSLLRSIAEACDNAVIEAYSEKKSSAEILADIDSNISKHIEGSKSNNTVHISGPVNEAIANMASSNGSIRGMSTGLSSLDVEIDGLNDSQLVVVAGRPSMGKSSLVQQFILEAACNKGVPVLLFSVEMSAVELCERFISCSSKITKNVMRNVKFATNSQKAAIAAAQERLAKSEIYINDSGIIGPETIFNTSINYKRKHGVGLVVIDYLQILQNSIKDRRNTSGAEVLDHSCAMLRALSRKIRVPVVLVSQLNRESEKTESKRPALANLKGSGAIESEPHVVILVHRPEFYDPGEKPGVAELIVAKNRNGKTGTVDVAWNGSTFTFSDIVQPISSFGQPPKAQEKKPKEKKKNYQDFMTDFSQPKSNENESEYSEEEWEYS
jgi:replicative DNA helicase